MSIWNHINTHTMANKQNESYYGKDTKLFNFVFMLKTKYWEGYKKDMFLIIRWLCRIGGNCVAELWNCEAECLP